MWLGVNPKTDTPNVQKRLGHNMPTILGPLVNMMGGGDVYDHLMSTTIFMFMKDNIFI